MNDRGRCIWCTLYHCKHNRHFTESGKCKILGVCVGTCFMDLFHGIRPTSCYHCLISKDKRQLKRIEEMFKDLQVKEGNTPCFELRELCSYER